MCAQTRPRFILSSERVLGGMEFEPMLTPREKIPSTGKCPQRRIEPVTLWRAIFGWLVGCLTSQQQASVSQGRICSDNFTCCHTEIEVADPTFYLTQSQYTDTGPTSPSADPITPGAWQGSHWYDSTPKRSRRKRDSNPGPSALEADALTTRPTRRGQRAQALPTELFRPPVPVLTQ